MLKSSCHVFHKDSSAMVERIKYGRLLIRLPLFMLHHYQKKDPTIEMAGFKLTLIKLTLMKHT